MENTNNSSDTILNLMVSHHILLEILFASFSEEAKNKAPSAGAKLSELMWEMKKHFFSEESAIFDLPPMKIMGVWEIIKQLKKEHIIMMESLQGFSDNLKDIKNEEIDGFHDLLERHRNIEELNLYPKLDNEMQREQRNQIISRINQIYTSK